MYDQNSSSDSNHSIDIAIEYFEGKFATLLEGIESVIEAKLMPIRADLSTLKSEAKLVRKVVKDLSSEQKAMNSRLFEVETRLKKY